MADLHDEKVRESLENLLGQKLPSNCQITINIEPASGEELADSDLENVAGGVRGRFARSTAKFNLVGGSFQTDLSGINFGTDAVSACW